MTSRRLLSRAFLGATALAATALPAPAFAQRVDRIIAFGDSLADDGNLFHLLPSVPPSAKQAYPTGRFTGGTNYVDTLSELLDAPVYNFAIGGALTNNTNTNGVGLPGLTFEVNSFAAGGGGVFPTIAPTFQEGDLVTVSIGGNDARIYQSTGGTVAGASAAATASVAAAETNLDVLVNAGAPTISYLALNTALAPEVATNPAAQAVRNAFAATFNPGIQDVLAGYAANGTIVHYLDASIVLQNVAADPQAFGITNGLVCPAFPNPTCIANAGAGYLFYGDLLHPTSQGSAIIAQYIAAQLQAPLTLQAPGELGLETARQFGRTLSSRVDLGSPRDGGIAEGVSFFAVGDTFSRDVKATSATDAFDIDGVGLTAGLAYGFGNGTIGLAGNVSRPKARFGADRSHTKAKSLQLGAFAGYAIAGAFAEGYLGYGKDDHDISRMGVIDRLDASADGRHWLAGAKAGYLLPVGVMRAGPVVALDYAKAKVDGYTEEGDAALTLNVSSLSARSLTGGIGAELRGDFDAGGMNVRPYASAMLEKQFLDNAQTVRFSQTSAPVIVNSWAFDERSKKAYGRVSFGGSAGILNRVTLNAVGSATLGRDDGNDVSAQVGLNVGF
jgi:phospholipase/lecithinase/hemolysin/uncharacterized protein YhjY with autotransporter beta-barrel domain